MGRITESYMQAAAIAGNAYSMNGEAELNSSETLDVGISIPTQDESVSLTIVVDAEGEAVYEIFEGSTYTGGTTITEVNLNRNSGNLSSVAVVADPTITVDGTLLLDKELGGGSGSNAFGGAAGSELIMKFNTKYVVRITSNAASNQVGVFIVWHETVY